MRKKILSIFVCFFTISNIFSFTKQEIKLNINEYDDFSIQGYFDGEIIFLVYKDYKKKYNGVINLVTYNVNKNNTNYYEELQVDDNIVNISFLNKFEGFYYYQSYDFKENYIGYINFLNKKNNIKYIDLKLKMNEFVSEIIVIGNKIYVLRNIYYENNEKIDKILDIYSVFSKKKDNSYSLPISGTIGSIKYLNNNLYLYTNEYKEYLYNVNLNELTENKIASDNLPMSYLIPDNYLMGFENPEEYKSDLIIKNLNTKKIFNLTSIGIDNWIRVMQIVDINKISFIYRADIPESKSKTDIKIYLVLNLRKDIEEIKF